MVLSGRRRNDDEDKATWHLAQQKNTDVSSCGSPQHSSRRAFLTFCEIFQHKTEGQPYDVHILHVVFQIRKFQHWTFPVWRGRLTQGEDNTPTAITASLRAAIQTGRVLEGVMADSWKHYVYPGSSIKSLSLDKDFLWPMMSTKKSWKVLFSYLLLLERCRTVRN